MNIKMKKIENFIKEKNINLEKEINDVVRKSISYEKEGSNETRKELGLSIARLLKRAVFKPVDDMSKKDRRGYFYNAEYGNKEPILCYVDFQIYHALKGVDYKKGNKNGIKESTAEELNWSYYNPVSIAIIKDLVPSLEKIDFLPRGKYSDFGRKIFEKIKGE